MTVSIIVAVKGDNPNLRECIESCLRLDYPDFEILVLPDNDLILTYPKIRIIPTGEVTPPIKRDMALPLAKGDIMAFLDDDAYPPESWLSLALKHFSDPEIAAVGGPAVTPDSDSLMQKASGGVYCSYLMSGQYVYRYLPKGERLVDDYPSCNFLVRKSVMLALGGFNTKFWPGEDTFLCLKIVRDLKKKIIYDPRVLVYHHRRCLFKGHLKQITNYALHRGYFVKRFPQTSFKLTYFIPSVFLAGLLFGSVLACFYPVFKLIYISAVIFYLILVFISSINNQPVSEKMKNHYKSGDRRGFPTPPQWRQDKNVLPIRSANLRYPHFLLILPVFWGIIISHLAYGLYFIKGLFSRKLREE